ncbi:MAG TPA: AI-2E family transporter [Chloroflexota bacterium]|nr:AI-2E family transporter [Chloroflexota bacterium]
MVFGASVSKWLALAALVALLWVARGVLPPFIVAGILAYVLSPLVDQLATRFGIKRPIVATAVFIVFIAILAGLVLLAGARLVNEVRELAKQGPSIIETVVEEATGGQTIELLGQTITSRELGRRIDVAVRDEIGSPSQAIQAVRLGFELTLAISLVVLSLFYMLLDGGRFWNWFLRYIPGEHREQTDAVSTQVHTVLGRYLRGQLILIVLMSTVTFLVLEWVFHLPYALWIGIVTGILEIIPLIGPFTAGAIACIVGFEQGGGREAAAIAVAYFILRQAEDQLVMPLVVGRAVHVHPLVTIFAVLTGEKIAGVLGMILAVPIAAAIKVVLDYAYPPQEPVTLELPPEVEAARPPAKPVSIST